MVGQTIGRYRVVERLSTAEARGSYRAIDDVIGRDVEITVLDVDSRDPTAMRRFRADSVNAARLNHPDIATVYELFEHDGTWLLAREFISGESLEALVARTGPLDLEDATTYCIQTLGALAHAHSMGVVHRQLNLGSVKVFDSDRVKILMHFGTAPADAEHATSAALMMGMAPEQLLGHAVDARADIYAVGVLLFYLLTAKLPFGGRTPTEIAIAKVSGQLASIESLRPDLPAWVSEVFAMALASNPDQRFQSAELFGEYLRTRLTTTRASAEMAAERMAEARARSSDVSVTAAPRWTPDTPPVPKGPADSRALDENVQFTVFRPRVLPVSEWRTMLVFAHLAERRADAHEDEPDPTAEVSRQAQAVLGDVSTYRQLTEDSSQPVPREGDLLFVPLADGIEFNPSSRAFSWTEAVHKEEFRMRARAATAGRTVSGRVTVYLGAIVIAEIGMTFRVGTSASDRAEPSATSARPYRNIFASYSHRDQAIVEEFSEYARAVGDRYLRDVVDLRSGERWEPGLEALIRQADVFQLFWSWNALASQYVRQEWQFALSLGRRSFVRPVYWDDPLPEGKGLPPDALRELHFERIRPRRVVAKPAPAPSRSAPSSTPYQGATPPSGIAAEPFDVAARAPSAAGSALPSPKGAGWSRYLVYAGAAAAAVVVVGVGLQTFNARPDMDGAAPSVAVGMPSPQATPSTMPPAPSDDPTATFTGVTHYLEGETLRSADAVLSLGHGQISVSDRSDGKPRATMSYSALVAATYTYALRPAWDAALPSPARAFGVTKGRGAPTHWLVLQARDSFMVLSLEDSAWERILQTVEDQTGRTVDRRIPTQAR